MIVDFPLPELGKEVPKATIITWHKKVGDHVSSKDVLLEVMSEKVNVEVESGIDGRLVEILHKADAEVEPGTILARFEKTGA
jgi:pyruvate/2-oxoglutarate dehydrogenase complex dihydrolipoamide acyltransferase (E2) component